MTTARKKRRLLSFGIIIVIIGFVAGCSVQSRFHLWASSEVVGTIDGGPLLNGSDPQVNGSINGQPLPNAGSNGSGQGTGGPNNGGQGTIVDKGTSGGTNGGNQVPAKEGNAQLEKPTAPKVDYQAKKGQKLVALTFDDGPDQKYTVAILDILKEYKVKASFFLVGTQVKKYPEMVARIAKEGHSIGNHTYRHPDLASLDEHRIIQEVMWTDTLIQRATGFVPNLVRAPYGSVSAEVKSIMKDNNRELVGWTVDTRDWNGVSVAKMRQNINNNTKPGGIVLMHSFGSSHLKNTVELLPLIISDLKKKGYTIVTVDELLAAKAHKAASK
ncbi:polysaccharide deacetylase family protein [Paenibacillus mendelii]|uniref:Polysaccharide deacetylase family protein n=1 Tax=Paenibacillus mendelii TaxID=206163 RepID=A0ABV6JCM0_9BACL|nr:polysaccharide deacetylase family protein [Paenibacillus mendelii]MCQ6561643.1 polysaccharide deacetylase family protein [Paenibacillus mendelii]